MQQQQNHHPQPFLVSAGRRHQQKLERIQKPFRADPRPRNEELEE